MATGNKAVAVSAGASAASSTVTLAEEFSDAMKQLRNGAKLPPAPLQLIVTPSSNSFTAAALSTGNTDSSAALEESDAVKLPKIVREYPLPGARQTHEMAAVGDNMLVVTQQTNSTMVKVHLSATTGRPLSCASFLVDGFWAGLHGLFASQFYTDQVWATLQFKSVLLRISPGLDMSSSPTVEQEISLPLSVRGPHCVYESGQDLWTSCKDSRHVVRINHVDPTDYSVYPCSRHPIFIAMHPTSNDMYASLDMSSKIWRLVPSTGETLEIDIPSTYGNTPVGLVAGTDGNVWFVLLGDTSGGTGTFARILDTGEFQWFSLTTTVGAKAGLIHVAFDWDNYLKQNESSSVHRIWLLGSTLDADEGNSIDAVFTVEFNSELGRIISQHSIVLPTQQSATHRILPHRTGLFVTELSVSSLAHIAGDAALTPEDLPGETSDFYADFGFGQSSSTYVFGTEAQNTNRRNLIGPTFRSATSSAVEELKRSTGRGSKRPRVSSTASTK